MGSSRGERRSSCASGSIQCRAAPSRLSPASPRGMLPVFPQTLTFSSVQTNLLLLPRGVTGGDLG